MSNNDIIIYLSLFERSLPNLQGVDGGGGVGMSELTIKLKSFYIFKLYNKNPTNDMYRYNAPRYAYDDDEDDLRESIHDIRANIAAAGIKHAAIIKARLQSRNVQN